MNDIAPRPGPGADDYLLTHPFGVVSVIFPPVCVIFSFRLVRSVFRRGHLSRFLLGASVLVINGAIIV